MIDAKRIEEMKRLSAEATEGAWEIGEFETVIRSQQGDMMIAETWRLTNGAGAKDAQFIAKSRQFVPDIIAAYDEQEEEITKLRQTLIDIYEYTSDLTIIQTITRRHYDIPLEAGLNEEALSDA